MLDKRREQKMILELKEREIEGIALLDVSGELQFGPEDLRLQDHVSSMIKEGRTKIIINLKHVQAIDPIVVGTIRLLSDECRR